MSGGIGGSPIGGIITLDEYLYSVGTITGASTMQATGRSNAAGIGSISGTSTMTATDQTAGAITIRRRRFRQITI
jgi:hypothetical protein